MKVKKLLFVKIILCAIVIILSMIIGNQCLLIEKPEEGLTDIRKKNEDELDLDGDMEDFYKIPISTLSKLEGNSYVLASTNSPYRRYATVTPEINGIGLKGNLNTTFSSDFEKVTDSTDILWTFKNGIEQENGFLYQVVNKNGEYLHINGTDVTYSTDENDSFVLVRLSLLSNYTGQIVISDVDGKYCLNWYGSENPGDTKFAAWNSADKNSHITLYKQMPKNEIPRDGVFFYEKANVVNADDVNGQSFLIVNLNKGNKSIYKKNTRSNNVNLLTGKELLSVDDTKNVLYSTSNDVAIYTFVKNEETGHYTISTTILGETKYLHLDMGSTENITSLTLEDVPQEFEVDVTADGIYLKVSNDTKKFYVNLNGGTGDFIGYNKDDINSKLYLYTSNFDSSPALLYDTMSYFESANIWGESGREDGVWGNRPEVESTLQRLSKDDKVSDVINGDEINNRFIHYDVFANSWSLYGNIHDVDLESFQDDSEGASHVWGKEFVFDYWEANDTDGNVCQIPANADISIVDGETVEILDINGEVHSFASGTVMTAKYTEFSDVISFYVNYSGTILDVAGDVSSRNVNEYTKAIAVGHIYKGKEFFSEGVTFDRSVNSNIISLFTSSYDSENPNAQIVIEGIADLSNDNYSLIKFEPATGKNHLQLAEHVLNFIVARNENVKLSSDKNPQPTVSMENASLNNYDVRWYVLKELSDGWHVDGVLAGKSNKVALTKAFYGLDADNENLLVNYNISNGDINSYNIDASLVKRDGLEEYFKLTTSNDNEDVRYGLYNYYGKQNGVYNWNVNCVDGEKYQFEENNYNVDGYSCAVVSTIYYKDGRVERKLGNDVAGTVQIDPREVDTISFDNYYTPKDTGMFLINKTLESHEGENENTLLTGAKFLIKNDIGTEEYTRIVTSDDRGSIFCNDLKAGTYLLTEIEAPDGFEKSDDIWKITVDITDNAIIVEKQNDGGAAIRLYSLDKGVENLLGIDNKQINDTFIISKEFKGLTLEQVRDLTDNYEIEITNRDKDFNCVLKLSDQSVQISSDGLKYTWYLRNFENDDYTITEKNYFVEEYLDVIVTATTPSEDNLIEVDVNKDVAKFSYSFNKDKQNILKIVNKYISNFSLQIQKIDVDDMQQTLPGAKFKVYGSYEEATDVSDSIKIDNDIYYCLGVTEETNENGLLIYSGTVTSPLKLGKTYALVEFVAPTGYVLDETPIMLENVEIGNPQYNNGILKETISNEKLKGKIVVHYYEDGTENSIIPDEENVGVIGDTFEINQSDKIPEYYELVSLTGQTTGTYTEETQEVIYYYKIKEYQYQIKYYYDGILDETKTDSFRVPYGTEIATFKDKVLPGYKLEKEENTPLKVGTDESKNIINVYYDKKEAVVYVHYYEEGTTNKVSEDVIIADKLFTRYTTKEATDIPSKYELVAVPDNATGEMTEEEIVVIYYYRKKATKVVVHHYEEGTTNRLSEDVTIDGRVDDQYTTAVATDLPIKYELVAEPVNKSGNMTEDVIEVNYYYKVRSAVVNIQYLEKGTNTVLAGQEQKLGKVDEVYEVNGKEIPGYKLVEDSGNKSGAFTVDPIVVTFYYLQNAKVTVNHIDKTTGDVLSTETISGLVGDKVTVGSKDFDNYVLFEKPVNETITMTKNGIVLNYYYVHVSDGVIEKHIDVITGEILANELHEGNEGDAYDISSRTFDGYVLVKDKLPSNSQGVMQLGLIEVEYYYLHVSKGVVVNYVDVNTGTQLLPEIKISGYDGDAYEIHEEIISGYDLIQDKYPTNTKGNMTKEEIVVTYYYAKKTEVNVKYIDKETGKEIKIQDTISGHEGESYVTEGEKIAGYDLVEEPANKNGKMTDIPIEVVYGYKRPAKVLVQYLDMDTKAILLEEKMDGHQNDAYNTEAKEIKYYNLVESPDDSAGKMLVTVTKDGSGNELVEDTTYVTYYYKKKVFNLKIDEQISSIIINGQEKSVNGKIGKIEVNNLLLPKTNIQVVYKVIVTNDSELRGNATIVENIPDGMRMNEEINRIWNINGNTAILDTGILLPGESAEYKIVLDWVNGKNNIGTKENVVKIMTVENEAGFEEQSILDNESKSDFVVSIGTGVGVKVYAIGTGVILMLLTAIGLFIVEKRKNKVNI